MKPAVVKAIIKDIEKRGWVKDDNIYHTPAQAEAMGLNKLAKKPKRKTGTKTGWIDDYRNIRNKAEKTDEFISMLSLTLELEVWPEFYFTLSRQWRFDYCIPEHKLYIEVEGGVWTGGRHTRGKGFINDMEKYNAAALQGWRMIRITPSERLTEGTLELIRKAIFLK